MVKPLTKPLATKKPPLNYTSNTLKEYPTPPKSRQQINRENYQKAKEQRKEKRRTRYQQQKLQSQLSTKQKLSKYYEAESIKVLISFKDYTELSKEKMKLWLDFNWTLKDCQDIIKEGFADVVAIMKLEQVASKLVGDYWATAKGKIKQKSKSWNLLAEEEQQKLIRYWGYEKARIENGYLDEEEKLEKQSQEYSKAIELAKFHEEKGKIKCKCYQCEQKMKVQGEIKQKWKKELEDYDRNEKVECPNCGRKVKELDEENDICKRCASLYD